MTHAMEFDADKDGKLGKEELQKFIASFIERHGSQGAGGGPGREGGPGGREGGGAGGRGAGGGSGGGERPRRPDPQ